MTAAAGAPLLAETARATPPATAALTPAAPPDLAALCLEVRGGDHPYFGTAVVSTLRRRLAEPELPTADRFAALLALARELFRLGELGEAAQRIGETLALADAAGAPAAQRTLAKRLLAVTHLRAAEEANCIVRHSAESCIFPIAAGGVHLLPEGARRAGDLYLELLGEQPDDPTLRWLLVVARMASGDYPAGVPERLRLPAHATTPEAPSPRWRDVAPELGVAVRDVAGGAVMEDLDGDGLLDLVSSTSDPCGGMKAFRNDGRGGFEEVSERWGLAGQLGGLNLVHADYDGDGMADLLVLRGGWWGDHGRMRKSLLRNDLKRPAGRFVDVTEAAGLGDSAYPTQAAAWADYDRDGDLDLYVAHEQGSGGPFPAQLFRNRGAVTFVEVAAAAGVENRRYAKAVAWGDVDDDGDPDLYVSNLGPNRLYRNDGDGTFTDVAAAAGVTGPEGSSFTTWFFDWDNDGDLDLFVADYSAGTAGVLAAYTGLPVGLGHPLLYRNEGGGRFRDVSFEAGLVRPALPMGGNYGDLDNDGWLDLYLGTGNPDVEALMPNLAYRNHRGRRFLDVTFAAGLGHLQKGHGVAFGDLDNDGDQDLFQQMGGAYPFDLYANVLYENPSLGAAVGPREGGDGSAAAPSWVTLRLSAAGANRHALGARLELVVREGGERRSIHLLVGSGGSFGGSSLQQEVGLGEAEAIELVRVRWPASARVQTFTGVAPRRGWQLVEGRPAAEPIALPGLRLGGGPPGHRH